jgi:hypothetical protein
LINPILGLSKKIQAMVSRIPGTRNGTKAITMKIFLNGVFVRSLSQARYVPTVKENKEVPKAKRREFQNSQ